MLMPTAEGEAAQILKKEINSLLSKREIWVVPPEDSHQVYTPSILSFPKEGEISVPYRVCRTSTNSSPVAQGTPLTSMGGDVSPRQSSSLVLACERLNLSVMGLPPRVD